MRSVFCRRFSFHVVHIVSIFEFKKGSPLSTWFTVKEKGEGGKITPSVDPAFALPLVYILAADYCNDAMQMSCPSAEAKGLSRNRL